MQFIWIVVAVVLVAGVLVSFAVPMEGEEVGDGIPRPVFDGVGDGDHTSGGKETVRDVRTRLFYGCAVRICPRADLEADIERQDSCESGSQCPSSRSSSGTFSGEILNYTKSGEKIWLYLNIAAVYDDAGKLINYVAVENDITLIKMAEHRLQKAIEKERELNRFKTQFVNLASHQFRTPLATIRSSIDLLDLKMESADVSPSFVDLFRRHKAIMTEETVRMTELMENILDIGRIDEGKIELSKKQCSFKQFMDGFQLL